MKGSLFEETGPVLTNPAHFRGVSRAKTAFSGGHLRFCLLHARVQG